MSLDVKKPKGYRKAWNGGEPPKMDFTCLAADERGRGFCRYPACDCEQRDKAGE